MLVEAAVLDRQHCFDQARVNGTQRHRTSFFSFPCDEGREYRRIERQALGWLRTELQSRAVIGQPDRSASFRRGGTVGQPLKGHLDGLSPELRRPGNNRHRPGVDDELAGLFDACALRVPEVVEAIDQLLVREGLPAVDLEWTGKYSGEN